MERTQDVSIRRFLPRDLETVVDLSVRAWTPVFASFRATIGTSVYCQIYPDWVRSQSAAVKATVLDDTNAVWVADNGGGPQGFVAVGFHREGEADVGEIDMLAVDPEHQRRGLGSALLSVAVQHVRRSGRTLAVIATGGDPGHEPARRTYERAGFVALPQVRYYLPL